MPLLEPDISFTNDASILRDYRLNVRLSSYSIISDTSKDFSGIDTYSVESFRENVGFGITNIQIETNASLQPVVEITFRDLYGNTAFSKGLISPNKDYSSLFDWPPPKFDLSFKGFLGRTTKMKLNLKKTDIVYNSHDGSFTIKCSFVPNMWGPFADIPTLFLYAVKKMKLNQNPKPSSPIVTFFDLVKIGKQVEVKTKNISNNYDDLKSKLSGVLGSLATEISSSIIKPGEQLKGVSAVKKGSIVGFKNITVYDLKGKNEELKSSDDVKTSNIDVNILSDYLLIKSIVEGAEAPPDVNLTEFKKIRGASENKNDAEIKLNNKYTDALNKKRQIIGDNLKLIDDEINAEAFEQNKTQISQIVIKDIFSKLGGDTGYILGKILQAGVEGFKGAENERTNNNQFIGKYFPLQIKKSEKTGDVDNAQVPVPVTRHDIFVKGAKDNKGNNLTNEWELVDEFTQAIAMCIGEAAQLQDKFDTQGRKQLVKRINNLEALQGNPYDSTSNSIIQNLVVRSGIWAFFTDNIDPNTPGSYFTRFGSFDDSPEKSARNELENITDATLEGISSDELIKLKNTCLYFEKAINDSNFSIVSPNKRISLTSDSGATSVSYNYYEAVSSQGLESAGIPLSGTGKTKYLVNNNLFWINDFSLISNLTNNTSAGGKFNMIAFTSRQDIDVLNKVNSSDTDSKYRTDTDTQDEPGALKSNEPPGIVNIDNFVDDSKKPGFGRIEHFNHYVNNDSMFNYEFFTSAYSNFINGGITSVINMTNMNALWDKSQISKVNSVFLPIVYTPFSFPERNSISSGYKLCWDLFGNSDRSQLQRNFLRVAFLELRQKIDKLSDSKKIQTGTISGQAQKMNETIYTQFHHIFYQWYSLIYNDETEKSYDKSGNNTISKFDSRELPSKLEDVFSGYSVQNSCSSPGSYSKGFQYIAPLIRTSSGGNIDVEDSVINLESCYHIDANTTVLNVIQNICTKNNFLFFPIAGGDPYNLSEMFQPENVDSQINYGNRFVVLWAPTPESRIKDNRDNDLAFTQDKSTIPSTICAFSVKIGSTDNALFKNVNVSTDSTKTTAESIVNLQRLVDKQVDNKLEVKNCSTIPIIEGRSYTCEVETMGNAQISPLQYFYLDGVPIFGGLYQIMGTKHIITPNNMTTTFKGFKMRFNAGRYGGIPPVTLKSLEEMAKALKIDVIDNTKNNDAIDNTPDVILNEEPEITPNPLLTPSPLVPNAIPITEPTHVPNAALLPTVTGVTPLQPASATLLTPTETPVEEPTHVPNIVFVPPAPTPTAPVQPTTTPTTLPSTLPGTTPGKIPMTSTTGLLTPNPTPITEPTHVPNAALLPTVTGVTPLTPAPATPLTPGQTPVEEPTHVPNILVPPTSTTPPKKEPVNANGMISENNLKDSRAMFKYYTGSNKNAIKYKLLPDAADSLDNLISAFEKSTFVGKQRIQIREGYRTLEEQQELFNKYGSSRAAKPGTSNHGWGVAVDFFWGVKTDGRNNINIRLAAFSHPNYKWFFKNAPLFGWYNPFRLRDNAGSEEWWHWEYHGLNWNQNQPEIQDYSSHVFNSNVDGKLIRDSGGSFVN